VTGMRYSFLLLTIVLCINGCTNVTTDSVVWRAQDISFADYQSLQILDVFNASGKPISKELQAYFTGQLKKRLENKGFEIFGQRTKSANALRIQTTIVYYELERAVVGSSNRNAATVKESVVNFQIVMYDQVENRTVAEIKNVTVYGSGVYKLYDRRESLFRRVAGIAADEITKVLSSVTSQ